MDEKKTRPFSPATTLAELFQCIARPCYEVESVICEIVVSGQETVGCWVPVP
jgi:hypothetical protein